MWQSKQQEAPEYFFAGKNKTDTPSTTMKNHRKGDANAVAPPTKDDVIVASGGRYSKHPGNVKFREYVDQRFSKYDSLTSIMRKPFAEGIYTYFTDQGVRFLRPCSSESSLLFPSFSEQNNHNICCWELLDRSYVVETKIMQRFRECRKMNRKKSSSSSFGSTDSTAQAIISEQKFGTVSEILQVNPPVFSFQLLPPNNNRSNASETLIPPIMVAREIMMSSNTRTTPTTPNMISEEEKQVANEKTDLKLLLSNNINSSTNTSSVKNNNIMQRITSSSSNIPEDDDEEKSITIQSRSNIAKRSSKLNMVLDDDNFMEEHAPMLRQRIDTETTLDSSSSNIGQSQPSGRNRNTSSKLPHMTSPNRAVSSSSTSSSRPPLPSITAISCNTVNHNIKGNKTTAASTTPLDNFASHNHSLSRSRRDTDSTFDSNLMLDIESIQTPFDGMSLNSSAEHQLPPPPPPIHWTSSLNESPIDRSHTKTEMTSASTGPMIPKFLLASSTTTFASRQRMDTADSVLTFESDFYGGTR